MVSLNYLKNKFLRLSITAPKTMSGFAEYFWELTNHSTDQEWNDVKPKFYYRVLRQDSKFSRT
jgi:hypothetical protein